MKKIVINLMLVVAGLGITTSCSDRFVETEFHQSVQQEAFKTVEEYEAALNGMYASMRSVTYYGRDFNMISELRGDLMFSTARSGRYTTVANLNKDGAHMLSTDRYATETYQKIYEVVAKTNIIINSPEAGITWKESLDPGVIQTKINHIKAQAYAIRAQAFFDLLRLYGQKYVNGGTLGIVMPLKYEPEAKMGRSTIAETENQIQSDFTQAINLSQSSLGYDDYASKTYLNSVSIKALSTRFYLYKNDYSKVRNYVNDVIASSKYSIVPRDLILASFKMNNAAPNSMFELAVGVGGSLGSDSYFTIMNSGGSYKNIKVRQGVFSTLYQAGDIRKELINVVSSGVYVDKYSNGNGEDNIKMMRYEEILLNGIEAELNGGNPAKALEYYQNILRNRLASGSALPNAVTMDDLKKERARELIGEGFRMWDNFRWGRGAFYATSSGVSNSAYDLNFGNPYLAFPIPRREFNVPGNKMVQNEGYDQ